MIIKQVNIKNWHSVPPQADTNLNLGESLGQPTGAGKESLAQKHRKELAGAALEILSERGR